MPTEVGSQVSDQELMRRIQADDAVAFGLLHDRLAPRALRVAAAVGTSFDLAHDAVQEGFLSVWRSRAKYRAERGDVSTWVFASVRNRAIDGLRRHARHERGGHPGDESTAELHAPGDVQAQANADDDARRLRALLARLPVGQRDVIVLAYFGELTHAEIAARLTLPLGTVKGRMRLGLHKLRHQIAA